MKSLVWGAALGSTLGWTGFDVVRKRLSRTVGVAELSFWLSVAQLPFYAVWAFLDGRLAIGPGYLLPGLSSVVMNLLSNLALLEAMRIGQLSILIPMLSFVPVFAAAFGGPMLGETLTTINWVGMALVTIGAFFLSASDAGNTKVTTLLKSFFGQRGVRLMLWVSLFWALQPICDKIALRHTTIPVHAAVIAFGVGLGMFVYLVARRRIARLRLGAEEAKIVAVGGGVNVLALGLQFFAISSMAVGYFESFKRSLGLFLAIAIGKIVFGEPISARKIEAGVAMAIGAVLVLL